MFLSLHFLQTLLDPFSILGDNIRVPVLVYILLDENKRTNILVNY